MAARCLQRAENQQRQDPGGEDTRMAGAQRGRRPRIGTDLGQLGLCSVLCSHHTRTPTSSPQLGKEKGSLGRERELPLNPEFASSVALGKVISLSEPQFVHLSNGLVIPFLHGCHENTWQVFQNTALSTWRHSPSPSPGLPGRGFVCTLTVSRRQCPPLTSAVHWATSEDQLGRALTFS